MQPRPVVRRWVSTPCTAGETTSRHLADRVAVQHGHVRAAIVGYGLVVGTHHLPVDEHLGAETEEEGVRVLQVGHGVEVMVVECCLPPAEHLVHRIAAHGAPRSDARQPIQVAIAHAGRTRPVAAADTTLRV
jgi:hypothetical protein